MQPDVDHLGVASRVGNYVLDALIGQGAFAQVWKCHHYQQPTRALAMKIALEQEFRRQLRREGCLRVVEHPRVVSILDSDTKYADVPYIVMPYYSGGSLADVLRNHKYGLPEERVESILNDVLAGLSCLHERGIIHGDVKPSNVLIDDDGRASVADFGLWQPDSNVDALRSIRQSMSVSFEDAGHLAGTIAYLAPEVLNGDGRTPAADVYAIGITLFEMLAGRRPLGLELPSTARPNLKRPDYWDGLFRGACSPREGRFANAACVHGPKKADSPLSVRQHETTRKAAATQNGIDWLKNGLELWDDLADRYGALQEARRRLDPIRARLTEVSAYLENRHPAVVSLRNEENQIKHSIDELRACPVRS